ncbi:MAG TPA: NAD(+) synthase [Kofleriaceae bacterium]|nr:NAD(+) synthase [Kofleriaceae bacterium]
MKLIKVAAAALNQTPFAWAHNQANCVEAIRRARADGVTILCLPEMAITGYGCEDAFFSPGLQETAFQILEAIAPETRGMVVCVGLPVYHEKALYNCGALLVDGSIIGFVAKRFLAGDGIHYEPRWFKEWPAAERDVLERAGTDEVRKWPIGDLVFDIGGIRVGFEICEDAWVANRPGADLALRGVDVILNPSASHFAFGKFAVRQRFVVEGSRAFGVAYLYANLLGNEAGRVIYDGGGLIASGGELCARGRRFSFQELELATAVVDVEANRREQARRASNRPRHDTEDGVVEIPFAWPALKPVAPPVIAKTWEDVELERLKHEEFVRAEAIGLWDYMRKSRSNGYVVSISGGADSAACAVLVAMSLEIAVQELGVDGVLARAPNVPGLREALVAGDLKRAVRAILLCAYQATANSGDVTRNAARAVADAIGAEMHVLDVEPLRATYVSIVEKSLGRPLTWEHDDVALQNIQARVRAPSIWMFANLRGALLLTTSNRSEAAVGYATMDGDTAGGLAPLGGIDKTYLRSWLRFMETTGPTGLHAIPALVAINAQQPTAELRPPGASQTDEGDLMPYDVLEAIEDAAIRDKRVPLEVLLEIQPRFPQHGAKDLAIWIERFFKLFCRNQWKRERLAPSFHLDDKNLDPRSWCRFPILSGNYDRELAELRAYVATLS